MLDVWLVRIQPSQGTGYPQSDDFKPFNEELLNFGISISNDDSLQLKASNTPTR